MLIKLLQGAAIGIAFVLPGISAGTVILLLGFYREFIADLSNFNLRPYLAHILGAAAAAYAGALFIDYLLEYHLDPLRAFLLGMLLASIRVVLAAEGKLKLLPLPLLLGAAGFAFAWFVVGEPSSGFAVLSPGSLLHFLIGGATASATMLLPGVSGSTVLIMFNLYDDVIRAVSELEWLNLACFAAGILLGLLGLARLISAFYHRYSTGATFLLAGLILGSVRVLLPSRFDLTVIAAAAAGALLVTLLAFSPGRKQWKSPPAA